MIDLITGHQGFNHITAAQIADINNSMVWGYGNDIVLRLKDGLVTSSGLYVGIGTGYWRANGYDMEITTEETIYVDASSAGTSRIDGFYVEILQDIASGNQRAEFVYVKGTEASVPTAPADPTAPTLTTDVMLQCVKFASATITQNTLVLTDLTKSMSNEITLVKSWIRDNADVYSSLVPYYRGEVVLNSLDGKIYTCDSYCSASTWANNQSHFTETTIVDILDRIGKQSTDLHKYGTCVTAAATIAKTATTYYGDYKLETGKGVYVKMSYNNTATTPTLNVDGTGPKTIKGYDTTAPSTWWKAGDIVHFIYDGSYFIMLPTQGQVADLNGALLQELGLMAYYHQGSKATKNVTKGQCVIYGTLDALHFATANTNITVGTTFDATTNGNVTTRTIGGILTNLNSTVTKSSYIHLSSQTINSGGSYTWTLTSAQIPDDLNEVIAIVPLILGVDRKSVV